MKTIGIIGCRGFVGSAVFEGMKHAFNIVGYDTKCKSNLFVHPDNYEEGTHPWYNDPLSEIVKNVDGPIFICLPTPMRSDGSSDTSIVEGVISDLNDKIGAGYLVVVIKSTVPPGTTERMNSLYKHVRVVFNPEFLREATAAEDFKRQDRIIIGGPHEGTAMVKQMYQIAYPDVPTTKTSSTIAEMIKYVTNCFLATKVSFANEIKQICDKLDIDYDKVVEYSTKDKRLGTSHWSVPGPDGHLGFGLTCFPKDLNALIKTAEGLGVDPKVMKSVWEKNLEVRPEKDWEKLKGRAVTNG